MLARRLDADGFGAVSIALAVCTFGVGLARALGTDPLVVRFSGASEPEWHGRRVRALGGSITVGVVGAGATDAGGRDSRSSRPLQGTLLVAAVVLPGLCLQDS